MNWLGYVSATAEDLSAIESGTIDAVVGTDVACSILEFPKVMQEIQRVLVPVNFKILTYFLKLFWYF